MTGASRVRVTILGNSVPLLVVPERERREDGTYPEVLERRLREAGLDATVSNEARLFELVHEGARRYGADVAPKHPDVLVLSYGTLELQPNVLPTTLNRALSTSVLGGRGLRRAFHRAVRPRVWPAARAWQRWASSRVGSRTWRLHPRRYIAEMTALVRIARSTRALVLVTDIVHPGERLEHFMPGAGGRWQRMQADLAAFVRAYDDPDVRLVEVSSIAAAMPHGGTADGLHLTADAHAAVADRLAKEIIDHLSLDEEETP